MKLTDKQRAQVNAALVIIHDSGNNAQNVTKAAQALIANGHPPTVAYSMILTEFSATYPVLGATMSKVTRLIQASTPESVAQYDKALSEYISTGNDTSMRELAPMIARDSMALAVKHGEMTEADASSGNYTAALGAEPLDAMMLTFAGNAPAPALTDAVPEVGAKQISGVDGPGVTAPNARANMAKYGYTGWTPDAASPFHGLTPAATREAARERLSGRGQGVVAAPVEEAA